LNSSAIIIGNSNDIKSLRLSKRNFCAITSTRRLISFLVASFNFADISKHAPAKSLRLALLMKPLTNKKREKLEKKLKQSTAYFHIFPVNLQNKPFQVHIGLSNYNDIHRAFTYNFVQLIFYATQFSQRYFQKRKLLFKCLIYFFFQVQRFNIIDERNLLYKLNFN
jgi:hypothetical protein